MDSTSIPYPLILIDGSCILCHRFAHFVIHQDKLKIFKFGALQDVVLKKMIDDAGIASTNADSVLVYTGEKILEKSDAVLNVFSHLPRYRQWIRLGYLLPRFMRNKAYDAVASRRVKMFGKKESCDLQDSKKIASRMRQIDS